MTVGALYRDMDVEELRHWLAFDRMSQRESESDTEQLEI